MSVRSRRWPQRWGAQRAESRAASRGRRFERREPSRGVASIPCVWSRPRRASRQSYPVASDRWRMVLCSRDGSLIGVATNDNTPVRHGITHRSAVVAQVYLRGGSLRRGRTPHSPIMSLHLPLAPATNCTAPLDSACCIRACSRSTGAQQHAWRIAAAIASR